MDSKRLAPLESKGQGEKPTILRQCKYKIITTRSKVNLFCPLLSGEGGIKPPF